MTSDKYLKRVDEMSDEDNPEYLFSTTSVALLVQLATGKIDAKKLAATELANQGLGKNGKWVGFEKAKKEWGVK